MLALISFGCDPQPTKGNDAKKPAEAKKPAADPEAECRKEKKAMLDKCMPGCNAQPDLVGEEYDACLQDCAQKEFGKPMPMCTR
jgi:hypothetical protein